jgi:hypothetical protein
VQTERLTIAFVVTLAVVLMTLRIGIPLRRFAHRAESNEANRKSSGNCRVAASQLGQNLAQLTVIGYYQGDSLAQN